MSNTVIFLASTCIPWLFLYKGTPKCLHSRSSLVQHRGATVGVPSDSHALRKVPGPLAESAVALSLPDSAASLDFSGKDASADLRV